MISPAIFIAPPPPVIPINPAITMLPIILGAHRSAGGQITWPPHSWLGWTMWGSLGLLALTLVVTVCVAIYEIWGR